MELRRVNPKALVLWRARLCLAALAPSFCFALFFTPGSPIWGVLTGLWVTAFLALFLWYYPLKYRKLTYCTGENQLVVNCGVIYTRRKSMCLENLQYITISAPPLARAMGLCTVVFQAAGGRFALPGISLQEGLLLQELLTPRDVPPGEEATP